MPLDREAAKETIRAKVLEIAASLGEDASELEDDEIIPASGFLDSAAILELVVWYEGEYGLSLSQDEINIDNLGSVNAMADFLMRRKAGDV